MLLGIDEDVVLMEISETQNKWTSSKTSVVNRLKNSSHGSQHGELISTVSEIIIRIGLMAKSIVMDSQHIDYV